MFLPLSIVRSGSLRFLLRREIKGAKLVDLSVLLHTFERFSGCAKMFIWIFYGLTIAQYIIELSLFNSF